MSRYFTIIHLALIVAAAYLGTFSFYRVLTARLETAPIFHVPVDNKQPAPETETGKKNDSFERYQAIIDRNLFKTALKPGSTEPEKKSAKVDVNTLKKTRLNLKLWGTVFGAEGKTFAVIEDTSKRKQRLFSAGDQIQSARVEMILREKVVLDVNGKKEILKIEQPVRGRKAVAPVRSGASPPQAPGEQPEETAKKEIVIKRSRIDDAIKNVNELMKHTRIRPHFTNGKPDGLKLTGIRPGSIFTEIGFRNGDIIIGVNGKPIESVDDALKFYTSLKNASNVDLQIRRRGVSKTIQYRVEE